MHRTRRAFTIVELLVVMGILALLVSLLMPGLVSAMESGKATKCASNLRQFGLALRMYLKDNDGLLPPHRLAKNPDGTNPVVDVGTGKKIRPRWAAVLAAYMEGAFLNPSATDDRQSYDAPVMACPAVPHWIDERNYAYGYNYQFLGNTRARVSNPSVYINWPVGESSITKTTRTIVMGDCMGSAAAFPASGRTRYEAKVNTVTALGNHAYALDPPYLASHAGSISSCDPEVNGHRSALDPRHNGRANALFCDGHVQAMTLQQAGYDVAADGRVSHGYYLDGNGQPVVTGDNRYFSGDFTNRPPPLAD